MTDDTEQMIAKIQSDRHLLSQQSVTISQLIALCLVQQKTIESLLDIKAVSDERKNAGDRL